jgi:hypothetical protein
VPCLKCKVKCHFTDVSASRVHTVAYSQEYVYMWGFNQGQFSVPLNVHFLRIISAYINKISGNSTLFYIQNTLLRNSFYQPNVYSVIAQHEKRHNAANYSNSKFLLGFIYHGSFFSTNGSEHQQPTSKTGAGLASGRKPPT